MGKREALWEDARRLQLASGQSFFESLNITMIDRLDEVREFMCPVAREVLEVARRYWCEGVASVAELDLAKEMVWDHIIDLYGDSLGMPGREGHLHRAVVCVLYSSIEEDWTEEMHCRETAGFFAGVMWDWCELTLEECEGLRRALQFALRHGRYASGAPILRASIGLQELGHIRNDDVAELGELTIELCEGRVPERSVAFDDLSVAGTAVAYVKASYPEAEAAKKIKVRPEVWLRLCELFAVAPT